MLSAQTHHTLRQLDSKRKVFLLEFIYKAGLLLTNQPVAIDLDGSDLTYIDFSIPVDQAKSSYVIRRFPRFALANVFLTFASFANVDLHDSDFSRVVATNANFSGAHLRNVTFFQANLRHVDLRRSYFAESYFIGADLTSALVDSDSLKTADSLLGATLPNGTYVKYGPDLIKNNYRGNNFDLSSWEQTEGNILIVKRINDEEDYLAADIKDSVTRMHKLIDLHRYRDVINEGHISSSIDGEWGDNHTKSLGDCSIFVGQLDIEKNFLIHGGNRI